MLLMVEPNFSHRVSLCEDFACCFPIIYLVPVSSLPEEKICAHSQAFLPLGATIEF